MCKNSWDSRDPVKPVQSTIAHGGEINSVSFHPNKDWMLATGSSDKVSYYMKRKWCDMKHR